MKAAKPACRSRFYHLLNPICPINHALKHKSDVWGAVIVIGLIFGCVSLMKLALVLTQ